MLLKRFCSINALIKLDFTALTLKDTHYLILDSTRSSLKSTSLKFICLVMFWENILTVPFWKGDSSNYQKQPPNRISGNQNKLCLTLKVNLLYLTGWTWVLSHLQIVPLGLLPLFLSQWSPSSVTFKFI